MIKKVLIGVVAAILSGGAFYFVSQTEISENRAQILESASVRLKTVAEERSKQILVWLDGLVKASIPSTKTPTFSLFLQDYAELSKSTVSEDRESASEQQKFVTQLLSEFVESIGGYSATLSYNDGGTVARTQNHLDAFDDFKAVAMSDAAMGKQSISRIYSEDLQLYVGISLPIYAAQDYGQENRQNAAEADAKNSANPIGNVQIFFKITQSFAKFIDKMPLSGKKDEIRLFQETSAQSQTEFFHKGGKRGIRTENISRSLELDIFKAAEDQVIPFSDRILGGSGRAVYYSGFKNNALKIWVVSELNGKHVNRELAASASSIQKNYLILWGINVVLFIVIIGFAGRREPS